MKKKNTLFNILVLVSFITLAYIIPKLFFQNDTFYSIKIGESITKHGIDMIDHFSFIANLSYTYPHWLFDLVIYLIYSVFGNFGIYIFVIILYFILLCLMYRFSYKLSKNKYISFLIVFFSGLTLRDFIAARAQLITYILLLIILYFINKLREEKDIKKCLIVLFLSSLLVANLHVAVWPFIFVLFLPYVVSDLIYLIANKLHFEFNKTFVLNVEKSKLKKTFLGILVCFIPGFMTPNFLVPFTYYIKTKQGISLQNISEHLPITINDNILVFILLFVVISLFLFSKSKKNLSDFFLLSGLFLLAFLSRRNYALLVILGVIPMSRLLSGFKFIYLEPVFKNIVFYSVFMLIVVISFIVIFKNRTTYNFIDEEYYPKAACDYILNNVDLKTARIFNEYNYGSYLMLRGIPVFVDSRADLYLEEFNKDTHVFEDFIYIDENYYKVFEAYDITHVLISRGHKINKYLETDDRFKLVYADLSFTLYEIV